MATDVVATDTVDFFGDIIKAGQGNNAIIGDNGSMTFTAWPPNRPTDDGWIGFQESILYYMTSSDPSIGGGDLITAGQGQNWIIGGIGDNSITAGDGGNTVIGANGNISFLAPNVEGTVENSDPDHAGNNTISTGLGNDRILGGTGTNTITDTGGSNVIFGADGVLTFVDDNIEGDSTLLAFSGQTTLQDDGYVDYTDGLLVSAVSTDTNLGGGATITVADGQNLIVTGYGSSTVTAGDGTNIIIGGNGEAHFAGAGWLDVAESLAPVPTTSVNTITAGNGDNIIIGGIGGDTITAGDGENIVFGDAGMVTFTGFNRNPVEGQSWDVVDDVILSIAQATYPTVGAADTIGVGSGNVVIFGGTGNDTITTNSMPATPADPEADIPPTLGSAYVIFGGTGKVVFNAGGWPQSETLTFPAYTGIDTITIGENEPVVLSGATDMLIGGPEHAGAAKCRCRRSGRNGDGTEPDATGPAADRGRGRGDLGQAAGT